MTHAIKRTMLRASLPLIALALAGCASREVPEGTPAANAPATLPACDPGNGGITLPQGFCAVVVADSLPRPRHIAVAPNGDLFIGSGRAGVVALRDANGDGKADQMERFGTAATSGIVLRGNYLYSAPNDGVLRYSLQPGQLTPAGQPDTLVKALPATQSHTAKSIALGRANELYVNIGSPTNVCQAQNRPGVTGQNPCPELDKRAGIWVFDAGRTGQTQDDGRRFATGLRNIVALGSGPENRLYGAQHGRDNLFQNWGQFFSERDGAEKPAEIFVRIDQGDDYGWPYCFFDTDTKKHTLAPEYGGDGKEQGRCAALKQPIAAFPGHWAPNGIAFYTGTQFPAKYRGGVFIAFHGSWNRAPLPQAGYNIAFVPMKNGAASGNYEVFADGFKGAETLAQPGQARYRPTGLAIGPDGSLYVTDDVGGRVWRIMYTAK